MLESYFPIFFMAILGLGFAGLLSLIAYAFGPKRESGVKSEPFESGVAPSQEGNKKPLNIKFYLVAMIFLIFDVEVIFLYPYAVQFEALHWPGFLAVSLFLAVLLVGIAYEWRKGALEWE